MKKVNEIILIILGVSFIVFLILKIFLVFLYQNTKVSDVVSLNLSNEVIINNKLGNDYYTYEDLKINKINDLKIGNINNIFSLQDGDDNLKITISKDKTMLSSIEKDSMEVGLHYNLLNTLIKDNIKNDYELIKYFFSNYNKKVSILTSINDIRKYMAINTLFTSKISKFNNLSKITGSYSGYLVSINNNIKEAIIYDGDYNYYITFYNLDNETIINTLNSIVIT